jgi:hypothetical protein
VVAFGEEVASGIADGGGVISIPIGERVVVANAGARNELRD